MRHTGARVSEAVSVDDTRDLDFARREVRLPTLKKKKRASRIVPLPGEAVAEFGRLLAMFPKLRGSLFRIDRTNVYRAFRARAEEAGIPRELAHPHVLRHTRAIELLRAGIPVTAVRDLLGHSDLSTTAVYLRFTAVEIRRMMEDRGLA